MIDASEEAEQQAWADRNGVYMPPADLQPGEWDVKSGTFVPFPAKVLREHELKTYRDCPKEYEGKRWSFTIMLPSWPDVLFYVAALALIAVVAWGMFANR